MYFFSKIVHHFIGLIYPNMCCVCGENLSEAEHVLCLECLHRLPRTNFHLQRKNFIEKRFWGKANIENASAFFFFQKGLPYRQLLHLLKYKGEKDVGVVLGRYAGADLIESPEFMSVDALIPVPLHPKKMRKRGYNQSECIALGMSETMHIPLVTDVLFRAIENPTQTKKSVYERWENVHGIFDVRAVDSLRGKHVLLVDDVLTTGSTLIACADALSKIPNIRISVFTLAVA